MLLGAVFTSLSSGKGDIARTMSSTAQFLQSLQNLTNLTNPLQIGFAAAVNRSYIDAAIQFSQKIDLDRIIKQKTRAPGRLQYSWADSGCDATQGLKALGKLLAPPSRISAVIGPACTTACEVTSYLAGAQNISQISWGCLSPALSNKTEFGLVTSLPTAHACSAFDCISCLIPACPPTCPPTCPVPSGN